MNTQLRLWDELVAGADLDDWTFNGASTRELTHCYHDYPARMIPQVAGKLLDIFGADAKILFDPYCGTGTSLVEGTIRGINVIGADLNPLARLIARTKTCVPDLLGIDKHLSKFNKFIINYKPNPLHQAPMIRGIMRLDFWFKPEIIKKLYHAREFIEQIEDEPTRLFFQVAFSETVRESSNTRNEEFKLYRYSDEKLAVFKPDVFGIMLNKLRRNYAGLKKYHGIIGEFIKPPIAKIYGFNSVVKIPEDRVANSGADIVVTSPPYGDSHTTVAYGQYSRLSAAWLGLDEPEKIDRELMGGKAIKCPTLFPCKVLNSAIEKIGELDRKRSLEIASFYVDLHASITNVAKTIKPRGHACFVVGNRKVKGIVLPTDVAVKDFFEKCGFEHVDTFVRSIPNKRMPLKNSPSNSSGIVDNTMTREFIVVMKRKPLKNVTT